MAMNRLPEDVLHRPIRPGVSLLNTSVTAMLQSTTTDRACAVKVVNNTRWVLQSAGVYTKGGHLVTAQYSVEPGTAETFIAEKYRGTATSCYGTASFKVLGLAESQYITIMWSVPFDRNIYSTWLGIEVARNCGPDDFVRMYDGPNNEIHSRTQKFKMSMVPLRVDTEELKVRGTIGNGKKTEALVDVYEVERGN